jgi:hypothetical protein
MLHIANGNPDATQGVAIEDAVSSGRVLIDGTEMVGPKDFSKTLALIDKPLMLNPGRHTIDVSLSSAPGSYFQVRITGTIVIDDLKEARIGHTATVLRDGTVLLVGGRNAGGVLDTAEQFLPATRQTAPLTGTLRQPRTQHTTTLLPRSEALLLAGEDGIGELFSVERFQGGVFNEVTPTLQPPRAGHTATGLLDGRVLILGGRSSGVLDTAELFDAQPAILFKPAYDPNAATFTLLLHNLQMPRWDHTATLLPDGRVLVIGGMNESGALQTAELFDPGTQEFTLLGPVMTQPRAAHTATLLPDGKVLILGGRNARGPLASGEVFDPGTGNFTAALPSLTVPRVDHTAVLLPFGEVLVSGGENNGGALASQEFYGPPSADAVAPVVVQQNPSNNATDVACTQIIGVRFSEQIDVRTLTGSNVVLSGSSSVEVTVGAAEQGLLVFLVPTVPLSSGVRYTLSLSGDIRDTAGNPLTPSTSSFTTVAEPILSSFDPVLGSPGISVTLLGEHFDPVPSRNVVKFNGILATVTAASPTMLTVLVPQGAITGPITLTTAGGTATSTTSFTLRSLALLITEPTPGIVMSGDRVFVKGSVTGSNMEVGVSVNGMPAFVAGSQWLAEIPLVTGSNPITAIATDTTGTQATASITINVTQVTPAPLILRALPESGIAPLAVRWQVINQTGRSLSNFAFDSDGTGAFTPLSASLDGTETTYATPGLRLPLLRTSDDQGTLYTARVVINVLARDEIDALLKSKWNGMKAALVTNDIERALVFFTPEQRGRYRTLFTVLGGQIAQIAAGMEDIQLLTVLENRAKYALNRTEVYGGEAVTLTYYVYFIQNATGLWSIEEF